jgi:uncharacterized protein YbaR (Trm112 family)
MARTDFQYIGSAKTSIHGTMICAACSKPITSGMYRMRETAEKYITVHRLCCPNDKGWLKVDAQAQKQLESMRSMLADCKNLKQKHGITELDELIEQMESDLMDTDANQ